MRNFNFIDLFAGIGGFHQAMVQLGGQCVYASEIDKFCIERYKENYNIDADHDITKINPEEVPDHDVLCGGFPCQAFSKAGKQKGFEETRGTALLIKYPAAIKIPNINNVIPITIKLLVFSLKAFNSSSQTNLGLIESIKTPNSLIKKIHSKLINT